MPSYTYVARNKAGAEVRGSVEAPSRAVATVRLRQKGLWILDLAEQGAPERTPAIRAGEPETSVPQVWSLFYGLAPVMPGALANFFEQLAGLYRAGVSMQTVVDDTADRVSSWRLAQVLRRASPRIGAGESLSDCLATYPQVFQAGVVGMVRAGEVSGNLDELARDLADEFAAEQRAWWWLLGPKLYFGVVLFLAALVPSFPWIIQNGFRWWLDYVAHNVLPWMGLLVAVYLVYRVLWWLPPVFQLRDSLAYRVPVWSALTRRVGLARFCRALQVMIRAGVEFPTAMAVAAQAAGNRLMVQQLQAAASRVRAGMPLHEALAACPFISREMQGLLGSAALGGTFDATLPRIAEQARASRDGLIRALRVGGFIVGYGLTSLAVVLAVVAAYLTLYRALAGRAGVEDLLK